MTDQSERDQVATPTGEESTPPAPAATTPENPQPPWAKPEGSAGLPAKREMKGGPPQMGVVVLFNLGERMARFPDFSTAAEQAMRQRVNMEPLAFYEGEDYTTELRTGARPGLVVKEGQSLEQAQREAPRD
jgi:hypothetical protein